MFQNVGTKEGLVERVVREIQEQITHGPLVHGMMLPPQRELCEQLGVSRTVVREAVRMLVTRGLLETRRGVGTVVSEVNSTHIAEPLNIWLMTQDRKVTLDNLHEVRQLLEVQIVRFAAERASPEDILGLQNHIEEMEKVAHDHKEFASKDTEFHQMLAVATHNPLLVILLTAVRDLMLDIRLKVQEHPDLVRISMLDHYKIVDQIASRNRDGAGKAMEEHLEHARRIQEESLLKIHIASV